MRSWPSAALQGSESGGHGCGPTSTLCFVPEVIDALQQAGKGHIPVLAAGGISDGRQASAGYAGSHVWCSYNQSPLQPLLLI